MSEQKGLAAYIKTYKGDMSLAEISRKSGGRVSKAQLSSYSGEGSLTNLPDARTMRGLAAALGRPEHEVIIAASESAGFDWTAAPGTNDLVIRGAGRLPAESQQVLVQMADNMLWWMDQVEAESVEDDRPNFDLAAYEQAEPTESDLEAERSAERGEESQESGSDEPA